MDQATLERTVSAVLMEYGPDACRTNSWRTLEEIRTDILAIEPKTEGLLDELLKEPDVAVVAHPGASPDFEELIGNLRSVRST